MNTLNEKSFNEFLKGVWLSYLSIFSTKLRVYSEIPNVISEMINAVHAITIPLSLFNLHIHCIIRVECSGEEINPLRGLVFGLSSVVTRMKVLFLFTLR
jgi:hypothetical protein